MAKQKSVFICSSCGYETPRWIGKCPGCGAWNTLEEAVSQPENQVQKPSKQRPGTGVFPLLLRDIVEEGAARSSTGISELDRVLGGGTQ